MLLFPLQLGGDLALAASSQGLNKQLVLLWFPQALVSVLNPLREIRLLIQEHHLRQCLNFPYLWEEKDQPVLNEKVREQPAADVPKVKTRTIQQNLLGSRWLLFKAVLGTTLPPQSISLIPYRVQLLAVLITQSTSFVFFKLEVCKSYSSIQRHAVTPIYCCKCKMKGSWKLQH